MVFTVDIEIFGTIIFEDVEMIERNVALVAILGGLITRWILINLSSRSEEMNLFDMFLGVGFTSIFSGEMSYITNPMKKLIRFQGPFAELFISFIIAYIFPSIGPDLVDFNSFQAFIFKALTIGYSANIFANKISIYTSNKVSNFRLLRALSNLANEKERL
ncbi:MAG: hypothetical protein ACXAD7_00450 [Candidatus Kariarchaeaceae archaeon]|jgi:hypothetical protein